MMNKSISLIFPMYNEAEYLHKAVDIATSALKEITYDYEVIIVDDASTDGSGQMAEEITKIDNKIKVVHHRKNRKLGGTLKTGFSNATKDVIVYTDMDLPFDLFALGKIVPLISEFDIVKGYRIGGRESLLRAIYSKVYNFLIDFVFQTNVKDVNFAMKIFKKEILDNINLKSEGSFINAEFLGKAKRFGYSIKEVGVEYHPRTYGFSRLSSVDVIFKILFEMVRFYPQLKFFSKKKVIYDRLKILYKKAALRTKVYNLIRFKTCPFDVIKKSIPEKDEVIDLGCGNGLFLNILRQDSNNRMFLGIDRDVSKIKIAMESLNGSKDVKFKESDITSTNFDLANTKCITLIDVLYYLNINQKRGLLKKCFNALDWNGVLIIKDIDKTLSLKFFWTFLQEFLAVKVFRFTCADGLYFENREKCLSLLRERGFIAEAFDLSKGYLYPHILYVCKK